MILPYWLAFPEILSNDLATPGLKVAELTYICDVLQKNLNSMKIKNLFPVQEKLMPWILEVNKKPIPFRPRDVCVSAVTGSGKTLSYAVPIVQHIADNRKEGKISALIMLPVFELATQVAKVFTTLCNNLKVRSLLLSKNRDFRMEQSVLWDDKSGAKVDIIVCTGGRLVEHLFYTKNFSLKGLKFLVIDEADHVMSQVHNDWYHHLLQHLEVANELQTNRLSFRDLMSLVNDDGSYKIPQKLLFSATLSQDPEKISAFNLFQPKLFTTSDNKEDLIRYQERKMEEEQRGNFIGKYTTPAELKEFFCITEYKLKPICLFGLIKMNQWKKFLCFTNTVETSHRLSFVLQTLFGKELIIEELSSLLPLKIRQKVLQRFSNGEVNGVVCTDALARGIDVPNIEAVISYDMPKILKIYIHRIGRTARAGNIGTSVTIIAPDQIKLFDNLIKTANKKSVQEMKPDRQFEEANALKFANAQQKLRSALEVEEKEKKKINTKTTGLSLFEKLQRQVKPLEVENNIVPESWKIENIKQNIENEVEKRISGKAKGKKRKDKIQQKVE
jgi:ATP-dependent RNA helicase DDX51/DBP6